MAHIESQDFGGAGKRLGTWCLSLATKLVWCQRGPREALSQKYAKNKHLRQENIDQPYSKSLIFHISQWLDVVRRPLNCPLCSWTCSEDILFPTQTLILDITWGCIGVEISKPVNPLNMDLRVRGIKTIWDFNRKKKTNIRGGVRCGLVLELQSGSWDGSPRPMPPSLNRVQAQGSTEERSNSWELSSDPRVYGMRPPPRHK